MLPVRPQVRSSANMFGILSVFNLVILLLGVQVQAQDEESFADTLISGMCSHDKLLHRFSTLFSITLIRSNNCSSQLYCYNWQITEYYLFTDLQLNYKIISQVFQLFLFYLKDFSKSLPFVFPNTKYKSYKSC